MKREELELLAKESAKGLSSPGNTGHLSGNA